MLQLFKNIGKNKELESVVARLQMNMSNNYKDAAQAESVWILFFQESREFDS